MRPLALAPVVVLAAALGCSASTTQPSGSTGAASGAGGAVAGATGAGGLGGASSTGDSGAGGGIITFDAGPGDDGGTNGCSAASQLVYVFSSQNDIYSFDPPSKQFVKIATPDCNAPGGANSMAIDRNLVAWINYIGDIYTFDLTKKTGCKPSGVALPSGFEQLGMGFSTDVAGGSAETLYVDGIGGAGLAKIVNGKLLITGKFANDIKLIGQSAELTGTGDARLYGYFTTSPDVRVAEIEKSNASVLSDKALTGVAPPSSWAFTFWGGDFYLYAAPGTNNTGNSSVIRYSPGTGAVDKTYVPDVGFTIIGAGVSTCAPVKPPA